MHFHRVCECFDGLTAKKEGVADLWSSENVVAGIGMFESVQWVANVWIRADIHFKREDNVSVEVRIKKSSILRS